MAKTTISKILLAATLGSSLVSIGAFAQSTTVGSIGERIDSSISQVGGFMDDSAITARVKARLIDQKTIKSTDISIKTENKIVTLSGFVRSKKEAELAVVTASHVEGVDSVNNRLHITGAGNKTTSESVSDYSSDTLITSKVKAKLLSQRDIASRYITVNTTDGVVQLTGEVKSKTQVAQVEGIVKTIEGVKGVKNALKVVK